MNKNLFYLALFLLISHSLIAAESAEPKAIEAETPVKSYISPLNGAIDLAYTAVPYQYYQWSTGNYTDANLSGIRIAFEWIPFGEANFGKPVFGVGTGFSWISNTAVGNGNTAALYILPVEPYIGYRMDYFKNQILVPYGKMGLDFAYVQEELNVSYGKRHTYNTYLGLNLAAGAELWLNFIDRKSARSLDSSTGINNVYLLVEYLKSRDLGPKYANLSREELRLGMRFEF